MLKYIAQDRPNLSIAMRVLAQQMSQPSEGTGISRDRAGHPAFAKIPPMRRSNSTGLKTKASSAFGQPAIGLLIPCPADHVVEVGLS